MPVKKQTAEERKKRKLETTHMDGLTGDERMAVELYQAIKKSKKTTVEEAEEEDVEDRVMAGKSMENTYNNKDEGLEEAEEEKRAITYQIAKNKASILSDF